MRRCEHPKNVDQRWNDNFQEDEACHRRERHSEVPRRGHGERLLLVIKLCPEFVEVCRATDHDDSFVFSCFDGGTELCGSGTRVAVIQQ